MDQFNKKNKLILITIWTVTLIITIVGATFGYFTSIDKTGPQIIVTQSLDVSLSIEGSSNVEKIVPTDWDTNMSKNEENKNIVKIPFNISSTSRINGLYTINMSTNIKENELLNGGTISDIKYRLYKDNKEVKFGNFEKGDFNVKIVDGIISSDKDLNDSYKLYVYIENKEETQNKLQDIKFSIILHGNVSQTS